MDSNCGLSNRVQDLELENLLTSVDLLKQQQESKQAQQLFEKAFSRSEKTFGFESDFTLRIALNYAVFLSHLKETPSDILSFFQRICDAHDHVYGVDHVETIHAWHSYARLLARLNKFQIAKIIFQRVLKSCLVTYEEGHEHTLNTQVYPSYHTIEYILIVSIGSL
jgi:tetratricopeptide (TPR) repeat protein